MQTAVVDMSRVLAEARTFAAGEVAGRIVAEIPFAIDRQVIHSQRRLFLFVAAVFVLGCAGSAAAGWWLRGASPALTCGEQAGGVVCWYWLQPPSTPVAHR